MSNYSIEFQHTILQYLVQRSEGLSYIEYVDEGMFDKASDQIILALLQAYKTDYNVLPKTQVNLLEYYSREKRKSKSQVSDSADKELDSAIRRLYFPLQSDEPIILASIIEYRQIKEMKRYYKEYAEHIESGDIDLYREMISKFSTTVKLSEKGQKKAQHRGGLLLADFNKHEAIKNIEGTPTFLHGLNRMTAAGGFYSPQLIILMGGPKAFKTGTALAIAQGLVKSGKKVYYVDTENGIHSIRTRFKQGLAQSTRQELKEEPIKDILESIVTKILLGDGEFVVDFYPAHQCSTNDVRDNLAYYKDLGFYPDVIIWDNPDNMIPEDKSIKEKRFKIQHTYFDIINLQDELQCWGLGLSQVNKNAVNKAVINMKDFAEDFGKAMNCHAAFALCRTEEEMQAGTARIVPVVQREGVPAGFAECVIRIDAEKQLVEEIDFEIATNLARRYRKDINDDIFGEAIRVDTVKDTVNYQYEEPETKQVSTIKVSQREADFIRGIQEANTSDGFDNLQ